MNTLFKLGGLIIAMLLFGGSQYARGQMATVYYQPTSYPARQLNGSAMPEDIKVVHVWDGWFSSVYNKTLVQNDVLQIGGWGDTYASVLRFDLNGLPVTANNVYLCLYANPRSSGNPSQVSMYRISSQWTPSTVGWNQFPKVTDGYYWQISSSVNSWRIYAITSWYSDWKSGSHPDNGILVWPYVADGAERFDRFGSSRVLASTDAGVLSKRPLLCFQFVPTLQLKLPLPGNHQWLVTTEVGGYDSTGVYDPNHNGINYFSIDFSWRNTADAGATTYSSSSDIPILAAASGRVVEVGGGDSSGQYNGFYVVLDHDGDININTGFTTRYLHLKRAASRSTGVQLRVGDFVTQGDQIGVMGSTGRASDGSPTSTGVHLHFGVRYKNTGAVSTAELTKVVMDGWLLKSFQTESVVNTSGVPFNPPIRYYRSGNRAY